MHFLRGIASFAIMFCYTLVFCVTVYLLALVELISPVHLWRRRLRGVNDGLLTVWVFLNEKLCQLFRWTRIETTIPTTLANKKNWWLIASNHQSWADILILQIVFRKLAPPIKFFTKRELIWVPFLGFSLWLLRFPYVRRGKRVAGQSRQQLHQKNRQELQHAATQFHERPISLLLFLEGTRFTSSKHAQQRPPFKHLLKPKLGGLAFSLEALGTSVGQLVNVTVNYQGDVPRFWNFLCGECPQVYVQVETTPITSNFTQKLKGEVTKMWEEKDRTLTTLRQRNRCSDQRGANHRSKHSV